MCIRDRLQPGRPSDRHQPAVAVDGRLLEVGPDPLQDTLSRVVDPSETLVHGPHPARQVARQDEPAQVADRVDVPVDAVPGDPRLGRHRPSGQFGDALGAQDALGGIDQAGQHDLAVFPHRRGGNLRHGSP